MRSFGIAALLVWFSGCDGGLAPNPPPEFGVIEGTVHYTGEWPPQDSVLDLRFVAFKIVPSEPADFFNVQNMVISRRLSYGVEQEHFLIEEVESATYHYSGIARQFSGNILDWEPLGLYTGNDGIFTVQGDTVRITIEVDFDDPPPFPPE